MNSATQSYHSTLLEVANAELQRQGGQLGLVASSDALQGATDELNAALAQQVDESHNAAQIAEQQEDAQRGVNEATLALKGQILGYVESLGTIPPDVYTAITAQLTPAQKAEIDAWLARVSRGVTVPVNIDFNVGPRPAGLPGGVPMPFRVAAAVDNTGGVDDERHGEPAPRVAARRRVTGHQPVDSPQRRPGVAAMRTLDRPVPVVVGPRPGPDAPTHGWAAQLFVAVERVDVDQYVWDDDTATWDDPETDFMWDAEAVITSQRVDATCSLHGIIIDHPAPDAEFRLESGSATLTLDNHTGAWSQYDAQGRLVDYLPGRALEVWADIDGEAWWLFAGQITAWRERGDGTVEVEALDGFTTLQNHIGTWTPGAAGDRVADRLDAICDIVGYHGPRRFEPSDVTLMSVETGDTPLEEAQSAAESDGGLFGVDVDGTLEYRNRVWRGGRPDQATIPALSDNVCDVPVVVWDAEVVTDDYPLVNLAALANRAEPKLAVETRDQPSIDLYGLHTLPQKRDDDLWQTVEQGQTLADYYVSRRVNARLRLDSFTLHLHDPAHDYWQTGIDRRRGDVVVFVHEQQTTTGPALLYLYLVVASIRHDITPAGWVATFTTSPTIGNVPVQYWDETGYPWDDPHPHNVWAY